MQTIEAYEKDILLQIKFLKKIKLERTLSETAQKNTIFCGTGDSFVASLLAEAISNYTTRAVDPLDLLKNKLISTMGWAARFQLVHRILIWFF